MGMRGNRHFAAQCGVTNRRFQYIRYPSINTLRRLWLCEGSLKRKLISTHPSTHLSHARTPPSAACPSRAVQLIRRETCVLIEMFHWLEKAISTSAISKIDRDRQSEKNESVCVFLECTPLVLWCVCKLRENTLPAKCVLELIRHGRRSRRICRWEAFAAAADAFKSKCVCLMHAAAHARTNNARLMPTHAQILMCQSSYTPNFVHICTNKPTPRGAF